MSAIRSGYLLFLLLLVLPISSAIGQSSPPHINRIDSAKRNPWHRNSPRRFQVWSRTDTQSATPVITTVTTPRPVGNVGRQQSVQTEEPEVTLSPSTVSMVVGETREIQAFDPDGVAVQGLSWSSSNTSVVDLSTDDPPLLTAISVGEATITAGDTATATITVYAGPFLPEGTVRWSVPGSSDLSYMIPAVPSPEGVADVFAFSDSGKVQAITADGRIAWTANIGTLGNLLPDFQGGLVADDGVNMTRLDGKTGQVTAAYVRQNGWGPIALHVDGTIFLLDGDQVRLINPQTGQSKASIQMQHGSSDVNGDKTDYGPWPIGLVVAGDGYAYVPYWFHNYLYTSSPQRMQTDWHLRVLRIASSGASTEITASDYIHEENTTYASPQQDFWYVKTVTQTGHAPHWLGAIQTNSDLGAAYAWGFQEPEYCEQSIGFFNGPPIDTDCHEEKRGIRIANIVGDSATDAAFNLPDEVQFVIPELQRGDGVFYGRYGTFEPQYADLGLIAFDTAANAIWTKPGDYYPAYALADGGLIAWTDGVELVTFDAGGNEIERSADDWTVPSWIGNAYAVSSGSAAFASSSSSTDATTSLPGPQSVQKTWPALAASWAAMWGGNHSGNGTAIQQEWFPSLLKPQQDAIWNAYTDLTKRLDDSTCSGRAQSWVFDKFHDVNGYPIDKVSYIWYVKTAGKTPHFVDGTRSTLDYKTVLCPDGSCSSGMPGLKVKGYFADNPDASAITQTPSSPLTIFLRPESISTDSYGRNNPNESLFFHESLHGMTGLADSSPIAGVHTLQSNLGIPWNLPSSSISDYILNNVLVYCPAPANGGIQ